MRLGWGIAGAMALCAPAALAQTTPTAPASPPPATAKTLQGVTVQIARPEVQRQIDRKSYSLANDQQAATGSLADVLRNLPSVDVDPQGQVSIRGDANVTILVDGQPSPLFQGPGRAQLLQQLPANAYDRVEVMTNPSAAFRPEGTGGIINLISKKRSKPGREGTLSAKAVSTDGLNANARGVYVTPTLTLSGTLFAVRNRNQRDTLSTHQLVDPASGEVADVGLTSRLDQPVSAWGAVGSASYQLAPGTRLLGDVTYAIDTATQTTPTSYRSSALTGVLAQDYASREAARLTAPFESASTSLVRTYKGDDHNLTLRVGYSAFTYGLDDQSLFDYQLPVQPNLYQDLFNAVSHRQLDLKAEYKAPLSPTSRLDIGYDGELTWDGSDNLDRLGTSSETAIVDGALDHAFRFDQSVQALFATFQTKLGRLTIMPGLRLEDVGLDVGDTGIPTIRRDYFEVYPTFHANYALTDRIDMSASYSRRVERPSGQELDPFRVYANPLSFSQGDPLLAPEITDSFEAEAVYTRGQTYVSADLFYRDHKNLVSSVTEPLDGGVLLNTYANEGHSRATGLELAANAPLGHGVAFNLSSDLFWDQISVPENAFERPSSGAGATIRPKLNWTINPKDFVQITVYAKTRTLTLQGYSGGLVYTAAGFRHKFNDRLSLDVTTFDPFNTLKVRNVIETPDLTETDNFNLHRRSVSIGLTLALGPHPRQTPRDFDFGAGAGAAPGGAGVGGAPPVGGGPAN